MSKIEKWFNHEFSSGGRTGEDFNAFDRELKAYLKKEFKARGITLLPYSRKHYFVSGFVMKNNKFVYFNIDDVRFHTNWHKRIYIRTAKHDKDYTGGRNVWTNFENLINDVEKLIENS